jgi:HlyD family secretion protein
VRKLIPVLVIAIAATLFWFRDHWLPQPPGTASYLGYVEGETVLIAAPQAGRIVARPVMRGGSVRKGDTVFSLDPAAAQAAVDQAQAALRIAEAQRDDLLTGKRPPEIEVIRAQKAQAEAGLALAQKSLARATALAATGTAAQQTLDQVKADVAQFQAQIAQFSASEAVANLRGREAQIAAAEAGVNEAEAALASARKVLADLAPVAPVDAAVDDTFFDVGEWVAAGQPVASLLPPGNLVIRFFVAEADLAKATPGTAIAFYCDGCGDAAAATIFHTESTPEYTPPVIYSQQARAKLVFLVEARPATATPNLRPGLPVEVDPLP